MKILLISNFFYRFGPPIALFRLAKELKNQKGVEVSVLSFLDGPMRKKYEGIGIDPIIENLYEVDVKNIKKLAGIIKKEKADLVITNTLDAINGCFAAHLAKVPGMLYVHEDWPQINLSTLHLFAFKVSDMILLSSKYQRSIYEPLLEDVPTAILSPGVPFDTFHPGVKPMSGLPSDKKIVSIVGTVCNRKRQDLFMLAAHEILKKRQDILFLIIGWYREEEQYYQLLKKYIQTAGLESNIKFLGDKEDIEKYYAASDAIACPSVNDIAPMVLLEALACKKPVIATDIDGIPEILKDGGNGILIENGNQKQLEEAIVRVLDNYQTYQNKVKAGYEKFKSKYAMGKITQTLLKLAKKTELQKKKYSLELRNNEVRLKIKKDAVLKFKKIIPIVGRKPSSSFR